MGGMWSLWVLAMVTIFMAVVKSVCPIARRTFARSVFGVGYRGLGEGGWFMLVGGRLVGFVQVS